MLILTSGPAQIRSVELLIIAFLLLIGPMALLFGADSRFDDIRNRERWWPGHGREKLP